jgi:hypothetical protein
MTTTDPTVQGHLISRLQDVNNLSMAAIKNQLWILKNNGTCTNFLKVFTLLEWFITS